MDTDDLPDEAGATGRQIIERLQADPAYQKMMAEVAERGARLREKFEDVDVIDLDEAEWQEWLSVFYFDRWRAKGRRQNYRYALKVAARLAGRPWGPNDPRAHHGRR